MKTSAQYAAEMRRRRRLAGQCIRCGVKYSSDTCDTCPECRKNKSDYQKAWYARIRDLGICVICRKPSRTAKCHACHVKRRKLKPRILRKPLSKEEIEEKMKARRAYKLARYHAIRASRIKAGLCVSCANPSEFPVCRDCSERRRKSRLDLSHSKWVFGGRGRPPLHAGYVPKNKPASPLSDADKAMLAERKLMSEYTALISSKRGHYGKTDSIVAAMDLAIAIKAQFPGIQTNISRRWDGNVIGPSQDKCAEIEAWLKQSYPNPPPASRTGLPSPLG